MILPLRGGSRGLARSVNTIVLCPGASGTGSAPRQQARRSCVQGNRRPYRRNYVLIMAQAVPCEGCPLTLGAQDPRNPGGKGLLMNLKRFTDGMIKVCIPCSGRLKLQLAGRRHGCGRRGGEARAAPDLRPPGAARLGCPGERNGACRWLRPVRKSSDAPVRAVRMGRGRGRRRQLSRGTAGCRTR